MEEVEVQGDQGPAIKWQEWQYKETRGQQYMQTRGQQYHGRSGSIRRLGDSNTVAGNGSTRRLGTSNTAAGVAVQGDQGSAIL